MAPKSSQREKFVVDIRGYQNKVGREPIKESGATRPSGQSGRGVGRFGDSAAC
jgi:hypothetical protein